MYTGQQQQGGWGGSQQGWKQSVQNYNQRGGQQYGGQWGQGQGHGHGQGGGQGQSHGGGQGRGGQGQGRGGQYQGQARGGQIQGQGRGGQNQGQGRGGQNQGQGRGGQNQGQGRGGQNQGQGRGGLSQGGRGGLNQGQGRGGQNQGQGRGGQIQGQGRGGQSQGQGRGGQNQGQSRGGLNQGQGRGGQNQGQGGGWSGQDQGYWGGQNQSGRGGSDQGQGYDQGYGSQDQGYGGESQSSEFGEKSWGGQQGGNQQGGYGRGRGGGGRGGAQRGGGRGAGGRGGANQGRGGYGGTGSYGAGDSYELEYDEVPPTTYGEGQESSSEGYGQYWSESTPRIGDGSIARSFREKLDSFFDGPGGQRGGSGGGGGKSGYNNQGRYGGRGGYNEGYGEQKETEEIYDAYSGSDGKTWGGYSDKAPAKKEEEKPAEQEDKGEKRQGGPYAAHYAKGPSINTAALKASQDSTQPERPDSRSRDGYGQGSNQGDRSTSQDRMSVSSQDRSASQEERYGQQGRGSQGGPQDRGQSQRGPQDRMGSHDKGPQERGGPQDRGLQNQGPMRGGPQDRPGPGNQNRPSLLGDGGIDRGVLGDRGYPGRGPGSQDLDRGRGGPGPGGPSPLMNPDARPSIDMTSERRWLDQQRREELRILEEKRLRDFDPRGRDLDRFDRDPLGPGGFRDARDLDPRDRFNLNLRGGRDLPPRDLPPRDLPPRDLPPRDLPPRDLPPRDLPPRDVPPRDMAPSIQLEDVMRQLQQQNATPDRQQEIQRQLAQLQERQLPAGNQNAFLREQQIRLQEQQLRQQLLLEQQRQAQILELQRQQQILEQQKQEAILQAKQQQLIELQRQQEMLQTQQLLRAQHLKQQQEKLAAEKKRAEEEKNAKEAEKPSDPNDEYECKVCKIKIRGLMAYLVHVQCKEHQANQAKQREMDKLPPSLRPKDYRAISPPNKSILKKRAAAANLAEPTPKQARAEPGYGQDPSRGNMTGQPIPTTPTSQADIAALGGIQMGAGLENILKQALSTVKNAVASQHSTYVPPTVAAAVAASRVGASTPLGQTTPMGGMPSNPNAPLFPSVHTKNFEPHSAVFDSADARASARPRSRSPSPPRRGSRRSRSPRYEARGRSPMRRSPYRGRSPLRNMSPPRNRSPPRNVERYSPSRPTRGFSPSGRGFSPPRRRVSPSGGRLPSPPRRRVIPSGGRLPSPPRRRVSPSGGRLPSPPRRRVSPSGGRLPSPPRRRVSPSGGRLPSPPRRRVSPSGGRLPSPPRRRVSPSGGRLPSPPRRRVSPSGGRLPSPPRGRLPSPPRRRSPMRERSPGRFSPPRRNYSPSRGRLPSPPRGRLPSPPRRGSPPSRSSSQRNRSPPRDSRNRSPPRRSPPRPRNRSPPRRRSRSPRNRSPHRRRSPPRARSPLRNRSPPRGGRSRSPARLRSPGRRSTPRVMAGPKPGAANGQSIDAKISTAIGSELAKLPVKDAGSVENIVANVVKSFSGKTDDASKKEGAKTEPSITVTLSGGPPSSRSGSRSQSARRGSSRRDLLDKDLEAVSDDEWDAWSGSVASLPDYENISSDDDDAKKKSVKERLGPKEDERKTTVSETGDIIVQKDVVEGNRRRSRSLSTPDSLDGSPTSDGKRKKRGRKKRRMKPGEPGKPPRRRRSSSLSSVSLDENEEKLRLEKTKSETKTVIETKPNVEITISNPSAINLEPPGTEAVRLPSSEERSIETSKQANIVVQIKNTEAVKEETEEKILMPRPAAATTAGGAKLLQVPPEQISTAYGCVMNAFAPNAVQNQTDVGIATEMLAELTQALVMVVNNEMSAPMRQKFTQTAMRFAQQYPGHRLVQAFNLASSVTPEVMDYLTKQDADTLQRITKVLQMRQDIVRTVLYSHVELQKLMMSLHTYPI